MLSHRSPFFLTRRQLLALAALMALAYALRVFGAKSSIAYIPDTQIVREAMDIGQTLAARRAFDVNMGEAPKYPLTLPYYLLGIYGLVFVWGLISGATSSLSEFTTFLFTQRETIHYVSVLALNVISVAVVPAAYFAARALNSRHAGWLAAIFATFDLLMVHFSHHVRPHAPMATLSFLSIVLLVRVGRGGGRLWTLAASVMCALTIGALQNGILVLVPLAIAWGIRLYDARRNKSLRREIGLLLVNAALTLALAWLLYPQLFAEYLSVASYLLFGGSYYLGGGAHELPTAVFRLSNIPTFLNLLFGYEPLLSLLLPLALPYFLWQKRADWRMLAIALPFPVISAIFWSLYTFNLPRYYLTFASFLIALGAYFLEDIILWLTARWSWAKAVSILLLTAPLAALALRFDWVTDQVDTRSLASRWIESNLPDGATLIANFQLLELTPTQASLVRQNADYPGSLGTYNQWLLGQPLENFQAGPAYDIVEYSYYWPRDDEEQQKQVAAKYAIEYAAVESYTAQLTDALAVPRYAQRYGTPVEIFCPGSGISGAYLPIDIYDGWAWRDIWQADRPGPIIVIFKLDRTEPLTDPFPLLCQ